MNSAEQYSNLLVNQYGDHVLTENEAQRNPLVYFDNTNPHVIDREVNRYDAVGERPDNTWRYNHLTGLYYNLYAIPQRTNALPTNELQTLFTRGFQGDPLKPSVATQAQQQVPIANQQQQQQSASSNAGSSASYFSRADPELKKREDQYGSEASTIFNKQYNTVTGRYYNDYSKNERLKALPDEQTKWIFKQGFTQPQAAVPLNPPIVPLFARPGFQIQPYGSTMYQVPFNSQGPSSTAPNVSIFGQGGRGASGSGL